MDSGNHYDPQGTSAPIIGSPSDLSAELKVFDRCPMAVAAIDTKGRCSYSNQKFTEISGLDDFRGHYVQELFADKENQLILEGQLNLTL